MYIYIRILLCISMMLNLISAVEKSPLWSPTHILNSDFISEQDFVAIDEIKCAMRANQLGWPYLYRYDGEVCQLSSMKLIPLVTFTLLQNHIECKIKIQRSTSKIQIYVGTAQRLESN